MKDKLIQDYLDFKEHFKIINTQWYLKDCDLKIDIFYKAVFGEHRLYLKNIYESLQNKTYVPEIENIDINNKDKYYILSGTQKHLTTSIKEVRMAFALYLSIKERTELARIFKDYNTTIRLFDFVNDIENCLKRIKKFRERYPDE